MEVLMAGLRAIVTHAEFTAGIGAEYQELFITKNDGKIVKRISLTHGRSVQLEVDKLPIVRNETLPKLETDLTNFFPNGEKIPVHLLDQIVAFFKKVMTDNTQAKNSKSQHAYEAMAHIVWGPANGYRIAIPTQRVSAAHVHYTWDHLEEGEEVILDIHSHNTMGAFFSGTDEGDDKNKTGFSGVVGKLDEAQPMFCWRFNDLTNKVTVALDDVFERGTSEVPDAWMDKVTFGYGNGYQYQQNGLYQHGAGGNRNLGKGGNQRNGRGSGNMPGNRAQDKAGGCSSIFTGLEELEDMTDEELAAFYGVDGGFHSQQDIAGLRSLGDELLTLGDGVIDLDDLTYEISDTSEAPGKEITDLLVATEGRTLGIPESRILAVDLDTLPTELEGVADLFREHYGLTHINDLFFDMSEYFTVSESGDGEFTFDDGGFICNRILTPKAAMAVLTTEGPYMIADFDTGHYLVGDDMVNAVNDQEQELKIDIRSGRVLEPKLSGNVPKLTHIH